MPNNPTTSPKKGSGARSAHTTNSTNTSAKSTGGRKKTAATAADVASALREQISTEELAPGDWMPSETDLMNAYGVTRYNAREALRALAAEGLIVTKHGSGSRVRTRETRPQHTDPRGLHQDGSGEPVRDAEYADWSPVEEPVTYRTNADVDLALALGVPEHTPVFVCDRLLTSETESARRRGAATRTRRMLHRLYLPITVCTQVPALTEDPFRTPDDLYATLTDAGYELAWTETVRAASPAPDDSTALHLTPGAAMLATRRSTTDATGRVLAVEDTRRSGEATQLAYTLTPTTPPASLALPLDAPARR
jgi:GntR family transcriptional regulator